MSERPRATRQRQAARASTNGHGTTRQRQDLTSRIAATLADQVQRRIPQADLDERDPDYIRETLPGLWMLMSIYFRGEVRGLANVPAEGPVLLVGNHSGGNVTPDTLLFSLAFNTYFGVERRFFQLAHNLVLSMPWLAALRKHGTVAASPENAERALDTGAALLVYPGGDHEVHRPSWESAKIDFAGRKGFIRLALRKGVPIVPVVSIGGQETALFVTRGERAARLLGLDRLARIKVLPVSLGPPFGVNVLDLPGRLPLPAKIELEVMEPIDLVERFGPDADPDEVYEAVTDEMQGKLSEMAEERALPLLG